MGSSFYNIFLIVTFFFFYTQICMEKIVSDSPDHLEMIIENTGYSLFHILGRLIDKLISIKYVFPLLLWVPNVASILIVRRYFRTNHPKVKQSAVDFATLSLFIVSMIVQPFIQLYFGIGTPNPWHNPTYLFARPFSIVAFIYFVKLYKEYKIGTNYFKSIIGFSVFSFLSAWAKPSFLMVFVPTSIFFLLVILIETRGSSLKFSIQVGLSYIPSAVVIMILNKILFSSEASMVFSFENQWYLNTNSIIVSVILGMAFPIYIFAHNFRSLDYKDGLAIVAYFVSGFEVAFLTESGARAAHGNFYWGYYYAMFFCFMLSIEKLFFENRMNKRETYIAWGLFFLHFISGIIYFMYYLLTGEYI